MTARAQQMHPGDRVRDFRLKRRWTQEEFGRRAGVSRETINRLENHAAWPTLLSQQAIAEFMGVERTELFDEEGAA